MWFVFLNEWVGPDDTEGIFGWEKGCIVLVKGRVGTLGLIENVSIWVCDDETAVMEIEVAIWWCWSKNLSYRMLRYDFLVFFRGKFVTGSKDSNDPTGWVWVYQEPIFFLVEQVGWKDDFMEPVLEVVGTVVVQKFDCVRRV